MKPTDRVLELFISYNNVICQTKPISRNLKLIYITYHCIGQQS